MAESGRDSLFRPFVSPDNFSRIVWVGPSPPLLDGVMRSAASFSRLITSLKRKKVQDGSHLKNTAD